jgi:hypothetical protein
MRASMLEQGKILIASVQGSMSDADPGQLLQGVRGRGATGVIVDGAPLDDGLNAPRSRP